ncbi:MAG: hypothetical protein R3E08_10430 [Thiotrichaceae bacterium]
MDYKITTKALDKTDSVFFKSMLQLIQNQLTKKWTYEENAYIVLVDLEQPEGIEFWISKPKGVFLIAYARQNFYKAEWFLQKPLRIQPLLQLLNSLATLQPAQLLGASSEISAKPAPATIDTPTNSPPVSITSLPPVPSLFAKAMQSAEAATESKTWLDNKLEYFEPSLYLLGLLQESVAKAQPRRFSCLGSTPLYVLPHENRCFSTITKMQQLDPLQKTLYSSYAKNIKVQELTAEDLIAEVQRSALRAYPIDTALWLAALHCSHGRLILGQSPNSVIRLKHWPNFIVLPHETVHVSLAAFMLKNATNLTTIAQKTNTTLEIVVNFFNACKLIGLTIEAAATEHHLVNKTVAEPKRRTFKDILNRLLR